MSNQSYDEAEIIQEIIETLKNGSKSRLQIWQDLLARGIPGHRADALIKFAVKEPYPADGTSTKPSTNEDREPSALEKALAGFSLTLILPILLTYDFLMYVGRDSYFWTHNPFFIYLGIFINLLSFYDIGIFFGPLPKKGPTHIILLSSITILTGILVLLLLYLGVSTMPY